MAEPGNYVVSKWKLDPDEEYETDFLWDPVASDDVPTVGDVLVLFQDLDHRARRISLRVATFQHAVALLCAVAGACRAPHFRPDEVAAAARELAAQTLQERLGRTVAGFGASVVAEGHQLVVQLDGAGHFRDTEANANDNDQIAHLDAQLRAAALDCAVTPKLRSGRDDGGAEPRTGTNVGSGGRTFAGVAGTGVLATGVATLSSSGLALATAAVATGASWAAWRRRPQPLLSSERQPGLSTAPTGTLTWAKLEPRSLDVQDCMSSDERMESAEGFGEGIHRSRHVMREGAAAALTVPLGNITGNPSNPLLASLLLAAWACILETVIGGRTIQEGGESSFAPQSRVMRSINLYGCRGARVTLAYDTPCAWM